MTDNKKRSGSYRMAVRVKDSGGIPDLFVDHIIPTHLNSDHTRNLRVVTAAENRALHDVAHRLLYEKEAERFVLNFLGGVGRVRSIDPPLRPPAFGEWIITLLVRRKGRAEAILGDLEERLAHDLLKRGERRAHWLYYARVLKSIVPLLWSAIKKLGIFAAVADVARRYLGG